MEKLSKKSFILVLICFGNIFFSQVTKVGITLSEKENYLNVQIESSKNIKVGKDIMYTNERWMDISKSGLDDRQLYLFIYLNDELVESRIARKDIQPSGPPEAYSLQQKKAEMKKREKLNIPLGKITNITHRLRLYSNPDELFKDYPCEIFNCWYDYYSLDCNTEYKMQVQLKVGTYIYKSNIIKKKGLINL